jgi:serine/threonine protein kinase/formylglycine-generating enzyme required for sulfatase activity
MNPDDQPSTPSKPPGASRAGASGMWQAPSVEEMQAMLPQYEILEILGRGGMGAVYKGRQKSLKRLVAIKILPPDAADDEMRFVERFENEAQTMAAMNHPAIVSVYDFGETAEGLLYFIMEFVDGTDVHKMIQTSGKLGDDYALAITAHVCDALDYAHSRGVIHRDIKPANILIDQEGRVKVADFGLAKMHDPSMTSGLTRTNMAMGTPDYVAPEALSMGMVVDHRADLYAVGVMLYQMLTGEVPRGMFRMPSEKGIGTDPRFDEIICKAMESDRDHRYQTASEVRHALDVILTTPQPKNDGTGVVPLEAIPRKVVLNVPGGPIGQSAVGSSRSQAAPPKKVPGKAVAGKGAPAKGPASPSGKSSTGLWVTVVGVVAALGVAGIFVMGSKPKPEPVAKVQPAPASPVDAAFLAQVAAAPAARQVELVKQKIEALNGTKVKVEPTIKGEKVTGLRLFKTDDTEGPTPDVSPLAALKDLDSLRIEYLIPTDISCLRGLKLVNLTIWNGKFTDVSVLQSFPLQTLSLKQTSISDFSVLKGKALQTLDLEWCDRLSDLSFIKGMPLKSLRVPKTKVRDLSPISGSPLIELVCDPEAKLDPALLASIPTLKKINLKPVSEWVGGSGNAPPSAAPGKTIDLLALVDVKRDTIAGEWVRTADGMAKQGPGTTVNGAPRLQLPYEPPEEYDFEVEFTAVGDNQSVGQILSAQSRVFSWIVAGNKAEAPTAGFELFDNGPTSNPSDAVAPMERNLKAGRRYVSRVEVRAGSVRGFLDGAELVDWKGDFKRLSPGTTGNLRDDKHLGLRAARDVVFHKITVREITGTGKVDVDALSGEALPNITHWQDVTAMVRENLRSERSILIEPDRMRFIGDDNSTVTTQISWAPQDRIIRVRYVGIAQISLWPTAQGGGSVFVLVQPKKTLFQHQAQPKSESLEMVPPVLHPLGFDFTQPHDLVVAVQGSTLRVWIDGRFIDEAQNEFIKETTSGLVFIKNSTVMKVEVAELESTATPPPTTEDASKSARAPLASTTKDAPFENSLGMKFVPVPATDVLFCIHETRYRDYAEYAKTAKEGVDGGWKTQTNDGFEIKNNAGENPVVNVNWDDAVAFCKWLSEKEGLTYRLPTDREWSLAVGIGSEENWKSDTTPATVFKVPDEYPWGKEWPPPRGAGNYSDESRRAKAPRAGAMYLDGYDDEFPTTAPVMSFEANKLGLFDLGGNGWEWCEDWISAEQKERVLRGASWSGSERSSLLSSFRGHSAPGIRDRYNGFRVVLEIPASSPPPLAENPSVSPSKPDPATPPATWTDWLGPKLAAGQFANKPGLVVEKDGLTTDQDVTSIQFPKDTVVKGPVRMTYLLRESEWTQLVFRINPLTNETYRAEDTGSELRLFRAGEGGANQTMLASEKFPDAISRTAERTLEFRVDGNVLRATVNGTFSLSAQDATLATESGSFWSITFKKGLLLKKVEIADGKETVGGAKTATKLDEDFIRAVAAATPDEQVSLVSAKLNEINGAEANLVPTIMGGKVKFLRVERKGDALLPDISPLAALKDLTDLRLMYVGTADISCLGGLPLERLELHGGTFEDISVLKSMPLRFLGLRSLSPNSQEALDFTILRGMKLEMLHLSSKQLVDISFIKGMLLKDLNLTGSGVRDFSPIAGMPLVNLDFDPEAKPDLALLRSIPTLKTINKRPAAEYLETQNGATTPWTDWLGPRLARPGGFDGEQWKREPEGFTTEKSLAGYEVLPTGTRDGAMKVTFELRDSQGVMINIRETKVGSGRQQYIAQYTGTSLYLAHASNRLITEPIAGGAA